MKTLNTRSKLFGIAILILLVLAVYLGQKIYFEKFYKAKNADSGLTAAEYSKTHNIQTFTVDGKIKSLSSNSLTILAGIVRKDDHGKNYTSSEERTVNIDQNTKFTKVATANGKTATTDAKQTDLKAGSEIVVHTRDNFYSNQQASAFQIDILAE